MPYSDFYAGFLFVAVVTGLLTISYMAGVSEIDDFGDDEFF